MRYEHLKRHQIVFLKMTGLRIGEFDTVVGELLPEFAQSEYERLSRADRQRETGVVGMRH